MQDRPTIRELLHAVQLFLEQEVVPSLSGRKQFHARVAANVLAIAQRELALCAEQTRKEWHRLACLLQKPVTSPVSLDEVEEQVRAWTDELCQHIRFAPMEELLQQVELWEHLATTVKDKLAIANPRLLAMDTAENPTAR
ncbi:MAG: hypothetical protein KatS3mg077_0475 [Candidatus Binatia bacterium]|nr:MAG: hypothetical protein KatS3mg077_0475 [Candidatus Binatia bacterium]